MKNYDNIIYSLLEANNDTVDITQKNLCSKEYYQKLLDTVLEVLKKNKHANLSEIRNKLYERSLLDQKLRSFFLQRRKAPGAVISFGTSNHQDKFVIGNSQEVYMNNNGVLVPSVKEMKEDTLFDLASCTKLFTSVAILQLAGNSELRLDDNIRKYLPQFKNIGNHTIFDLLTYEPYHTERRIDEAKSIDEAESILFTATPYTKEECEGKDRYNDIAPMILKYIVEKVSGMSFEEYVQRNILNKAFMKSTYVKVPDSKLDKVANYNYFSTDKGIISDVYPGIATDRKAVVLGQPEGKLSGHAGLFSTSDDMGSFGRGLINGLVLHPALTREMAKCRTHANLVRTTNGINYVPYYGFLCNSKHPNIYFSEVFQPLSGSSLSQSGWSGSHITIDPINDINISFLSNRTHNRVVSGNNNSMINATIYGYEKKEIINACLELAIQEKILEEIIGKQIEKDKEKEKIRIIR